MSHRAASPAGLTAAILARTSGPACGRLRDLACDLVDGSLSALDADLARGHLGHCPDCRGLVVRLETAGRILPFFADLDPGRGFTNEVLRLMRAPRPLPAQAPDRLLVGWARFLRRPRAALEAAYLATAAGLVLTHVPLPGLSHQAGSALVSLVRTGSRSSLAGAASRGQRWAVWAQGSAPVHVLHRQDGFWPDLWARLSRRVNLLWLDLAQAARQARAGIWYDQPRTDPPATEPSGGPARPAP